jgi:HSP20 family protein
MNRGLTTRNNNDYLSRSFKKSIDRLFDDFFLFKPTHLFENDWEPKIDVEEDEKAISVKAEIPGVNEKDLDVRVENGYLVVSGEKREERKEEKGKKDNKYIFSERRYGSFYRSIKLPEGIKTDNIDASFKKGVLKINIPKEGAEEPKKIELTN